MRLPILTLLFTIVALSNSGVAQTITFRGSDTLGDKMVPELAKAYEAAGNAANFDIVASGSSEAFKALAAGEAEIGMSSRPIKDSEKDSLAKAGLNVVEHVAGVDMIAVIVNPANSADDISVDAVGKIFTSAVQTWKTADGAPIKAYTRNESSGTFKVFQELAMGGADYGATTTKLEGNGDIAKLVASSPGGVGYVGLSYANAPGVKALKVGGVVPDPANSATYPLSRKLYYYTIEGRLSPEGKKFIAWATSDKTAGKIITNVGFIPVK